jgi:tripartite ATP-independent transporter DctP family solute receptor
MLAEMIVPAQVGVAAMGPTEGRSGRKTHREDYMLHWTSRIALGTTLAVAALGIAVPAGAQTKLKWAHVYEVAEPYHTEALWAAEEIKKRTNGKYEIQVFPASQLGNENQINEGLGLGTVDMIYTGVAFAGSIHKPIAITNAPYVLRDFDHWKAYRDSKVFRDIAKGYEDKTKHKVIALTYYGQRMITANKEIKKPEDMKGMKLRVPPAPLFLMFTKSVGANATPIAFAEVYLALQQKTVDGQENPLPTIMAKKFYEVQSHIMLSGHITESLLTIVGTHVWSKLSDDEKKIFNDVLIQAAAKATDQIRASEQKLADEFRKLGKTVVEVDRDAFRKAALPLHNDGSGGWSQAEYDALQALK